MYDDMKRRSTSRYPFAKFQIDISLNFSAGVQIQGPVFMQGTSDATLQESIDYLYVLICTVRAFVHESDVDSAASSSNFHAERLRFSNHSQLPLAICCR